MRQSIACDSPVFLEEDMEGLVNALCLACAGDERKEIVEEISWNRNKEG